MIVRWLCRKCMLAHYSDIIEHAPSDGGRKRACDYCGKQSYSLEGCIFPTPTADKTKSSKLEKES